MYDTSITVIAYGATRSAGLFTSAPSAYTYELLPPACLYTLLAGRLPVYITCGTKDRRDSSIRDIPSRHLPVAILPVFYTRSL